MIDLIEHEAEQRMIKNCISKAIQYYQTNDIALGNHNNLNSLGMRTIPDPKAYNVEHVKKVTEDYFKSLVYGADDGTVDGNLTYKAMATQAYSNTFHIANMFLGVYCKDKYRVNGSCWTDYKKNDEQSMMVYMLERIVYYWNNNSSNPGVPSGSGRMSDLAAENPFLPLHLAVNNWIARNMIISLLGNTKKLVRNINGHKRVMLLTAIFHQRPNPVASVESSGSMSGPMAALNMNTILVPPWLRSTRISLFLVPLNRIHIWSMISDQYIWKGIKMSKTNLPHRRMRVSLCLVRILSNLPTPLPLHLPAPLPLHLLACLHLSACHLLLHLHPLSHLLRLQRLTKELKKGPQKRQQPNGQGVS